jgi:hypothetical protein
MLSEIPAEIELQLPWQGLQGSGAALVRELARELPHGHVLDGLPVVALARRVDCDDILFATADPAKPLAVVHLTWTGSRERDPTSPWTTLYQSWQDWAERCLVPDHKEYYEHK